MEKYGYPARRFQAIPFFPVSSRIFHDDPLDSAEAQEGGCDMIYVGHRLDTPDSLGRRVRAACETGLHPLLDRLDAVVMEHFRNGRHLLLPDATRAFNEIADSLGLELSGSISTTLPHYYAYRMFDSLYREQILLWVSEWAQRTNRSFRLYGRGWEAHPTLGRWAMGPIEHGETLRKAYRGASLAIQPIPTGFKHQRTFEALLSGTLVLTRYSPNDYELLSMADYNARFAGDRNNPGTPASFPLLDRVVFHDQAEFEHLAESLLQDADAREELQREFRQITSKTFTYDAVVPRIVDYIRSELSRTAEPVKLGGAAL